MAEEMWQIVRLGDVADVQTGLAKNTKALSFGMAVPYLRVANVQDGYLDLTELKTVVVDAVAMERYSLRAGDVLFTEGGDLDKLGRGCVWQGQIQPCVHQNHVFVVRPRPGLLPEFLAFYARGPSGKAYFLSCAKQTTNLASINSTQLKSFPVPLPTLSEQEKIVAILSALDDAIAAAQAVIDQLQVVKKAVMAELLTRGLPGRHTRFKQTGIGEVPDDWNLCSIDDLGITGESAVRTGPFGSSMKSKDFRDNGIRVLTIQSLGEGRILHDGLFYVDDAKAAELAEYKVRENDVVFSRVADIGRCAAIGKDEAGWLISPNLSRIRLDPSKADAAFLMYLLTLGATVAKQIQAVAGNGGRPVITSTTLRSIILPIPSVDEQVRIARAGREIEDRIAREEDYRVGIQATKVALMSLLLSGEIRIGEAAA